MTPERYMELRRIADAVIADCAGGRDHWEMIDSFIVEEAKIFDTMALECTCCNQYSDASDMNDNGAEYICHQCKD